MRFHAVPSISICESWYDKFVASWRALELDQVVVAAVGSQEGASMLKVLAFCVALERAERGEGEAVEV